MFNSTDSAVNTSYCPFYFLSFQRLHSTEAERLSMDEGVQRMEGTDSPRRRSVATKKDVPAMSHLTATEESETDALKNEAANREKKMTKNKRVRFLEILHYFLIVSQTGE